MGGGALSLKMFSSLVFTVQDLRCFEEIFTKDDSLNESMNNKGVCKTGLATLGLLTYVLSFTVWNWAELKSIVLYCTQLHPTILRCLQNLYMRNAQNSPKGNDENHIHNILSKTPSAIFLAYKKPAGVFLLRYLYMIVIKPWQ